jgi:iron-sulfur cluster repair protein YtfE (RIC family)
MARAKTKNNKHNFDQIVAEMANNSRQYDAKQLNFLSYSANIDTILEKHGWTHKEYYSELKSRASSGVAGLRRG